MFTHHLPRWLDKGKVITSNSGVNSQAGIPSGVMNQGEDQRGGETWG